MIYLISYRYLHCWVSSTGRHKQSEPRDAITIENNHPGAWFYNKQLACKNISDNLNVGDSWEEVISIVSVVEVPHAVIPESHWVALE